MAAKSTVKANVFVTLKSGVLDPQGRAVAQTLSRLGFTGVADVRVGKFIEIELDPEAAAEPRGGQGAEAQVTAMAEELLANPVIEEFRVEIVGASGDSDAGEGGQ